MKIPITIQLAVLTVLMTGFYMMVGQAVPQKEVHPPEVIEISEDISTEQMVAIGKGIFEGKGICATCHTIGKSGALRFPDLDGLAERAADRKPGYTALDYLAESLYEPGAFIVDGFNPGMPEVDKPPIGLTDQEVLSVIAYLQTLGGEPTVTMQTKLVYTGGALGGGDGDGETGPEGEAAKGEPAVAAAGSGDGVLTDFGCSECHYSDRPGKLKASSLYDVGARLDGDQLFLALSGHEKEERLERSTLVELQTLVQALAELKG